VAIQLSDTTCSQQGAHLLAIFDARQGKLLQRFDLDVTLTSHGVTHVSGSPGEFGPPLWSPDGKLITMPNVFEQGQAHQKISTWGLLLLPLDRGEARALSSSADSRGGVVWGIQAGKALSSARTLPPALTCYVGADGQVTPDRRAIYASATPSYTGSTTSGELSRWSSGAIASIFNITNGVDSSPHAW
jgi:hypothetical protein